MCGIKRRCRETLHMEPLKASMLYGRPIDTEQTRCDTPPLLQVLLLTVALVVMSSVSLSLPSTNVGAENFLVNRSIDDST